MLLSVCLTGFLMLNIKDHFAGYTAANSGIWLDIKNGRIPGPTIIFTKTKSMEAIKA